MLKDRDILEKGFVTTAEKSNEACKADLEDLRKFIVDTRSLWENNAQSMNSGVIDMRKWGNSLVGWCFVRSVEDSAHILYLTRHGLYRNAYDTIRHMLESVIQALYFDTRYQGLENNFVSRPQSNIYVKLAILREVEDKRDYHALRLLGELDVGFKDRIREVYRELSQMIHPSYRHVEKIMEEFVKQEQQKEMAATVNCEEVRNILKAFIATYDIFLFFYLTYFSEAQDSLAKTKAFVDFVEHYNLLLSSKLMKGNIKKAKDARN